MLPTATATSSDAEVDRVLHTCAQEWHKGLSGMLGMHGDKLVMLGLIIHAHLMSW